MDWIKFCKDTPYKPEIAIAAEIIGKSHDEALGLFTRLFCWLDSQTSDGFLPNLTLERLSASSHVSMEFCIAMASDEIRWLIPVHRTEAGTTWGIEVVNWDRHNGKCAKKRAESAYRMAKSRAKRKA